MESALRRLWWVGWLICTRSLYSSCGRLSFSFSSKTPASHWCLGVPPSPPLHSSVLYYRTYCCTAVLLLCYYFVFLIHKYRTQYSTNLIFFCHTSRQVANFGSITPRIPGVQLYVLLLHCCTAVCSNCVVCVWVEGVRGGWVTRSVRGSLFSSRRRLSIFFVSKKYRPPTGSWEYHRPHCYAPLSFTNVRTAALPYCCPVINCFC